MKEYKKLFMEIFTFIEDVVTSSGGLSNGGDGGDVGSEGDGGSFGGLFGN